MPRAGESEYRFTADGAIRTLLVNDELRKKLSSGALVIARLGDRYELLPRGAGDKVRERVPDWIVLEGSPPFSRTLTRRPIEAMRSVHVEAKEVQCGVQAWCG